MAKKQIKKSQDNSDSLLFAFLGIFLTLIGYVIVVLARKDDKYALYYAKQGLALFIAWIIAAVASWAMGWIPIIGGIVTLVLNAVIIALWVVGIIYSLSGKEKEIPIIGPFAKKIE
jgi:uncharacterized membrane protein